MPAKKTKRPVKSTVEREKEKKPDDISDKGLRIAWIKFIDAYIENGGNGLAAYKVAYPGVTDETAKVNASKLLTNANVRDELNNKLSAQKATEEFITDRLIMLVDLHAYGKGAIVSVKALEILAKMKGMLVDTKKIAFTGDNPAVFASPYSAEKKAELDAKYNPADGKVPVRIIE